MRTHLPRELPTPAPRRVAVRVTADAARRIRAGHPWVFDGSITAVSHEGAAGDLAVVFDPHRRFAGIGLLDPTSPIRVKVLHAGTPAEIGPSWWAERIAAALARRAPLQDDAATTGWRIVHGENDGLPGLVLDRYGDVGVLKLYTAAWFPHLRDVADAIAAVTGLRTLVLRLSRAVHDDARAVGLDDGTVVFGDAPPAPALFREHGLVFGAETVRGQKTGWFLDQRDNRGRVRARSRGAHVLDVFSAGGGFSVHAAAGGARSVLSVDQSRHALAETSRWMDTNRDERHVAACEHRTIEGDAFTVLVDLAHRHERFDVVVVDPPSFASRRDQVAGARRAYGRLTALALAVVRPGGTLLQASCSSHVSATDFYRTVVGAASEAGWHLDEQEHTGQPLDHPIGFPEGAYLKAVIARVRRRAV